ncbi:MAG: hypothetical protein C4320_10010 [Armatimonadota bacterium]
MSAQEEEETPPSGKERADRTDDPDQGPPHYNPGEAIHILRANLIVRDHAVRWEGEGHAHQKEEGRHDSAQSKQSDHDVQGSPKRSRSPPLSQDHGRKFSRISPGRLKLVSELLKLGAPNARPRAPKADEVELRFSPQAVSELAALQTHYPTLKSCILPALWIAQREYGGHLSGEAIAEVAHRLRRSYAEVEGVATFYSMYNTTHVPGRNKLELCTCLSCHLNGAYRIKAYLEAKLGISFGETTPDGEFTLEEVECLNACDRAVVMQVGDSYHGPVDEAYVDRLIEELRRNESNSNLRLADQIVQCHLGASERQGELLP